MNFALLVFIVCLILILVGAFPLPTFLTARLISWITRMLIRENTLNLNA